MDTTALERQLAHMRSELDATRQTLREISAVKTQSVKEQKKLEGQIGVLNKHLSGSQTKLQETQSENETLKSRVAELEAQVSAFSTSRDASAANRRDRYTKDQALEAAAQREQDLRESLEKLRSESAVLSETCAQFRAENGELKTRLQAFEDAAAEAKASHVPESEMKKLVAAKNMHISKLDEQIHQLQRDVRMASQYKIELEDAQRENEALASALAAAQREAQVQTAENDTYEAQIAEAKAAVSEMHELKLELEDVRKIASKAETVESQLEEAREHITDLERDAAVTSELAAALKDIQKQLLDRNHVPVGKSKPFTEAMAKLHAKEKENLVLRKRLAELKGVESYKEAIEKFRKQLDDQNAHINKLVKEKEELQKAKATVVSLRRQLQESRDANEEKHRRIVELMNQVSEKSAKLSALSSAASSHAAKSSTAWGPPGANGAVRTRETMENELRILRERCQTLAGENSKISALQDTVQSLEAKLDQAYKDVHAAEHERTVDAKASKKSLDSLRQQLRSMALRNAELEKQLVKMTKDLETCQQNLANATGDNGGQPTDISTILQKHMRQVDASLDRLRTESVTKNQDIAQLKAEVEQQKSRLRHSEEVCASLRKQLEASASVEKELEESKAQLDKVQKSDDELEALRASLLESQSRVRDLQLELDRFHKDMRRSGTSDTIVGENGEALSPELLVARIQELENELLELQIRSKPATTPVRLVQQKRGPGDALPSGGIDYVTGVAIRPSSAHSHTSKISSSLLPPDSYSYTVVNDKPAQQQRWKV